MLAILYHRMMCSACLPLDSSNNGDIDQETVPEETEEEIRYRDFVEYLKQVGNVSENPRGRKTKDNSYPSASFAVGSSISEAPLNLLPRL